MKDYINANQKMKSANEGSSLAIALFFFMMCALICAGILYVANSSIFGVSKNFNADDVQEFVAPPTPTSDPALEPTPTLDPSNVKESKAIKYVYDTLAYEYDELFNTVSSGGTYNILWTKDHGSLSYEIMSYVNGYFGRVYRTSGNKYLELSEKIDSDIYFVDVDGTGDMLPKEFIVSVSGYDVKVVFDLDGTQDTPIGNQRSKDNDKYNYLKFNTVKFTVSAVDGSGCSYVREYNKTYSDGYFYLKWAAKNGSTPKRFEVRNYKWW